MARKQQNDKKKEKHKRFSFFSDMDPVKKSNILKYTGVAVTVFTLFTLFASVSYLFTWQADQSLMTHPDMMDKGVDVANICGKAGYRWSHFLVSRCFGLGSFALVILMGAIAYRLFFWDRHTGLVRTALVTVSGTSWHLCFCLSSLCSSVTTPSLAGDWEEMLAMQSWTGWIIWSGHWCQDLFWLLL